jgi:dolichyl-phosphate-mannose-protein mannosyltransferase
MKKLTRFVPPTVITIISFITHFIYFGYPQSVVFDEVYTGNFLNNYWHGTYFFDVHPPLGKLLIMFFANIVGATHNVDWSVIGNAVPHWVVLARIVPMLAGALLPLVIYGLCRVIKMSVFASFLACLLICFENSLIVQSRFLLTDGMLVLFGFSSLLFYYLYHACDEHGDTNSERRESDGRNSRNTIWNVWKPRLFIFLSAVFAGAAASIKWTGLSFIIIIGILEIIKVFSGDGMFKQSRQTWKKSLQKCAGHAALYGGIFCAIYLSVFAIHFSLLPDSGPGDAFMTPRFQKTLTGSVYASNPSLEPEGFVGKFIELNLEMYAANQTMTTSHPYSSKWYTWPLMLRPIFYWQSASSTPTASYIYLLGNPLIYWSGTMAIIAVISYAVYAIWQSMRKKFSQALTCITVGFLVNFIPFIFIGRVMFLYHYEAALVVSIMAIAFLFDRIASSQWRIVAGTVFLLLCFLSFVFFSPLTYGLPLSAHELSMRMWLASWR